MTSTTREPGTEVLGSRLRYIGPAFATAWLIFMIGPITTAWELQTWRGDAGAIVLLAFAATYLVAAYGMSLWFRLLGHDAVRAVRILRGSLAVMVALGCLAYALVDVLAIDTIPYLGVIGCLAFGRRGGWWVAATSALALIAARAHGFSWDESSGYVTGTLSAGLSVWAFSLLTQRQRARVQAAEAEGALAVETERGRFARDLHDIVGHSLSVVTMKAGLARRLLDVDPERARIELVELERLSREALDDVRRAVGGYRDISLPGELARARDVLDAAGIVAEVPTTADDVDPRLRELFAWTVREGVTNVVRHSGARRCHIELVRRSLTIEDDGRGFGTDTAGGNGLLGLAERAAAVGAVVLSESVQPQGFRLTVSGKENQ